MFIIYSVFNCYAIPVIVTHVNNFEKTVLEDKRILTYEAKPNTDASEVNNLKNYMKMPTELIALNLI